MKTLPKVKKYLDNMQNQFPHMPVRKLWKKWCSFSFEFKKSLGFFEGYLKSHSDMYPITKLAVALFLLLILSGCAESNSLNSPLYYAQMEIGHGESGGNNLGPDIRKYMQGQENLPWCAGFMSYCFKKANYGLPYTLRAIDFIRYSQILAPCELRKGDLVVFMRAGGGHIGIIEKLTPGGFVSIEGNVGEYPAKVKRVNHLHSERKIYRYIRPLRSYVR